MQLQYQMSLPLKTDNYIDQFFFSDVEQKKWPFLFYLLLLFANFIFSEPKERAKEPDKGNIGLSGLRQGVITNENASHDDIQRSCQQLIDDINAKRKRDTDLLNGKVLLFMASWVPFIELNPFIISRLHLNAYYYVNVFPVVKMWVMF